MSTARAHLQSISSSTSILRSCMWNDSVFRIRYDLNNYQQFSKRFGPNLANNYRYCYKLPTFLLPVMTPFRIPTPLQKKIKSVPSTFDNIKQAWILGGISAIATAPFINPFNRASIVASRYNLTGIAIFRSIYSGKLDKKKPQLPGCSNFLVGIGPHLIKENIRCLLFKAPGLGVYLPWLQTQYSPHMATQLYAISMSVAEIIINPVDTLRVALQAGDPITTSFLRLYKGALLNGVRQYGVWATVGYNNMLFDPVMSRHGIDPYSFEGIAIKAYPQATINVGVVYFIERIKNELQFDTLPDNSRARDAARYIYQTQGWAGFFRGFLPKTPAAAIQHFAACSLIAWGKKRTEQEKTEERPVSSLSLKKG
jgi:hypothetical protein